MNRWCLLSRRESELSSCTPRGPISLTSSPERISNDRAVPVASAKRYPSWLFAPSVILLGALHGLEPGHSKTMMAAFIIVIRDAFLQTTLLSLSATASHTTGVWAMALSGHYFWRLMERGACHAKWCHSLLASPDIDLHAGSRQTKRKSSAVR